MKNRIIALVVGIVFLLFSSLFAQPPDTLWTKTYGGVDWERSYSVQECASKGFIIAGWTEGLTISADVYLIRTDSVGDTLWTKTYGGLSWDYGLSVQECASGGFIITGWTESFGAGYADVYLIRTDSVGDTLWTKTYGGAYFDRGFSVQECASGGFIIVGEKKPSLASPRDVYLIRTDSLGDTLWTKTYGGVNYDYGSSVQECASGGFIIAGYTRSFSAGHGDVYLIRTDSNGDTLWTKTYGGVNYDWGSSVQECASGGFIIVGYTEAFPAGSYDVYLIRTDSLGDTLWTKTYGGVNYDWGFSVQECASGGFIIAGYTESFGAGYDDVYLIRTDSLGDTLWTKTYGGVNYDWGFSIQECASGGFIIAGGTESFGAGMSDVYLIRIGPEGGIEENENWEVRTGNWELIVLPNPFTTSTTVSPRGVSNYQSTGISKLEIYDASGRFVRSIELNTSSYQLGADLTPGVYFLKFTIGEHSEIQKLIKIR